MVDFLRHAMQIGLSVLDFRKLKYRFMRGYTEYYSKLIKLRIYVCEVNVKLNICQVTQ